MQPLPYPFTMLLLQLVLEREITTTRTQGRQPMSSSGKENGMIADPKATEVGIAAPITRGPTARRLTQLVHRKGIG